MIQIRTTTVDGTITVTVGIVLPICLRRLLLYAAINRTMAGGTTMAAAGTQRLKRRVIPTGARQFAMAIPITMVAGIVRMDAGIREEGCCNRLIVC